MLYLPELARCLLLPALLALAAAPRAQTESAIFQINQSGIGSNGFGTTWRGQDVQIDEDAWLTRIVFQAGSAGSQIDEIRLMTAVPAPVTLATVTTFTTTVNDITAILPQPYMLRGGVNYTVWFHQTGSPLGTSGCDMHLVNPTWGGYHTNVDPTVAPGPGEPSYFWAYQYGTNVRLIGYDNLEISGNLVLGGSAQIQLDAPMFDLAIVAFGLRSADLPLLPFSGPLRLDPTGILPTYLIGIVDQTGIWTSSLSIPNNASLHGFRLYVQAVYDPSFAVAGTMSPMDTLLIL